MATTAAHPFTLPALPWLAPQPLADGPLDLGSCWRLVPEPGVMTGRIPILIWQ